MAPAVPDVGAVRIQAQSGAVGGQAAERALAVRLQVVDLQLRQRTGQHVAGIEEARRLAAVGVAFVDGVQVEKDDLVGLPGRGDGELVAVASVQVERDPTAVRREPAGIQYVVQPAPSDPA